MIPPLEEGNPEEVEVLVKVEEVSYPSVPPETILGSHIETPRSNTTFQSYELSVIGWIVTAVEPATWIAIRGPGLNQRFELGEIRPDLTERFGGLPPDHRRGFRCQFSVLRLPNRFQLTLFVGFGTGAAVPVAKIRAARSPLSPRYEAQMQPLMLHCIGRSGSTWVTHLLGEHPEIVAYKPFQLEPRMAGYWMEVMAALSEPASYTQALQPEVTGDDWWLGRNRRTVLSMEPIDPEMARWLGGTAIESLAALAMVRIDDFYKRAAANQGKETARFFVERSYGIGTFAPHILPELYPGAREVILTRDFRDVFSSMRSFKGASLPRRHLAKDDADYVKNQLKEYVVGLYRMWKARKDTAFLLRYEDLVQRPVETLSRFFLHVGVDSNPHVVEQILTSAKTVRLDRQSRHKTSRDALSSIGRWVVDLEPAVKEAFQEEYDEIFEEFGYSMQTEETRVADI